MASKTFTLKCEASKDTLAFEMEVEQPADYQRNGPPLLLIDQNGNYYVRIGQRLSGKPDEFGYRFIRHSEIVQLNNPHIGRIAS
jgi:hypothetical protein